MSKKVLVGRLAWDTTDQSLREAFSRFGDIVEVRVMLDRDSGRSRGFGFVTFEQRDAAQTAIDEMDGAQLDGRTITADEALERRR